MEGLCCRHASISGRCDVWMQTGIGLRLFATCRIGLAITAFFPNPSPSRQARYIVDLQLEPFNTK